MALQFADAVGMPRAALLPLVFADPDAGQMSRNGAGLDQGWCDGASLPAIIGEMAAAPLAKAPRAVSSSHIRYWQACTDVLHARGREAGGTVLLVPALQQWQHVRLPLKQGTAGDDNKLFLVAAGGLALCTGWMVLDAGYLPLARSLYEQAAKAAADAGDAVLTVQVLASQSLLFTELARCDPSRGLARRALRLAFQAQEEGRYLPMPQLHALIALRHASAAALLGDRTAFSAAIMQARRELDRGPRDGDRLGWLQSVDEAETTGVEASGYLDLGDAGRSVRLYRQVLAVGPSPRSRAICGAGLAAALLRQGASGDAVSAAVEVLPALEAGIISIRCLDQLRLVRQAVASIPGAEGFCGRFDEIDRVLAGSYGLPGRDAFQETASTSVLPHPAGAPVGIGR
jgi:hypothetical protein